MKGGSEMMTRLSPDFEIDKFKGEIIMAEKNIKTRIIHKHDTEENWNKATNFIPKQGEIIVYDIDSSHSYERIKVGDGMTNVISLPYVSETVVDAELSATSENPVQNKVIKAALDKKIDEPSANGLVRKFMSGMYDAMGVDTTMPDSPTNADVPTTKLLKDYVENNTSNPLKLSDTNLQKTGLIAQSYQAAGSTPGTVGATTYSVVTRDTATLDDSISGAGKIPSSYAVGEYVKGVVAYKVDKIEGKGLSTNDYTNEDKAEVAKIASKADINNPLSLSDTDKTKTGVLIQHNYGDETSGEKYVARSIDTNNLSESGSAILNIPTSFAVANWVKTYVENENTQISNAMAEAVSEIVTTGESTTEHTLNYMPDSSTFIGAFIHKYDTRLIGIYSSTGNYLSPFIEINESLIGKTVTLQYQLKSNNVWGAVQRGNYIKSVTAFTSNDEPNENGYFNIDYIINHSENITGNSDDGTYAVYTIPQGTKYLRISAGSAYVINSQYRSMFVINDDGSLLSDYVANGTIVVEGNKELSANVDVGDINLTQVSPKHKKSLRVSSLSQLFTSYEETNADYISVENTYLNTSTKVNWLYGLYDALMEAYPNYITRTQIATTAEPTLPVYKSDGTVRTDITSESVFPMYRYDFKPPIAEHTLNVTAEYSKKVSLPKILYTTGIHGGEYRQVVAAYRFFKMLCEKWRDYELLSDLRWNCHFVVIPLTNPFGFNYPSNRYDSNGVLVSKRNEHNIDISGNFPSSSYQSGTDNVYGTTPLSEPESQALYNIIKNENFILSIDNHTFNYLAASGNTDKMAGYFIANHKHNNSTAFWFKISRWLNQRVRKLSPGIDSAYDNYDMAQIWGDSREQMLSNTFASVGGNVEMTLGIDPNATVGDDGVTPSMAEKTQAFCVDELAVIFYEALQDFYTY